MKNYEKCRWIAEYMKHDCLWRIVSPLGVIVTRCYNKRQAMDILLEIAQQEPTNGKAEDQEEDDEEEEGFLL